MIKAIIFDYDGVLVDSIHIAFDAYLRIAQHTGVKPLATLAEFQEAHRLPFPEMHKKWGFTEQQNEIAKKIFYETLEERRKDTKLIPSTERVLKSLAKRYRLAIVSGNRRGVIEKILREHGVLNFFETIIGEEDVKNIKPDPESMLLCLKRMNLNKREALFVGDMVIDIEMGKAAGVKTIIMHQHSWNCKEHLDDGKPDKMIHSQSELLNAIQEMENGNN